MPAVRAQLPSRKSTSTARSLFKRVTRSSTKAIRERAAQEALESNVEPDDTHLSLPQQDPCPQITRLNNLKQSVFGNEHIRHTILAFLDIDYVQTVGHTNTSMRKDVTTYTKGRVRAGLRPWIDNYEPFRAMLRDLQAVVGGSAALNVCINLLDEPHDLNVFVPRYCADPMIRHLKKGEGYKIQTKEPGHRCPLLAENTNVARDYYYGVASVTYLEKPDPYNPEKMLEVTITESADYHALSPIFMSHATFHMGWISADSVTVSYPCYTFWWSGFTVEAEHRVFGSREQWMGKWGNEGFAFHSRDHFDESGVPCGSICRSRLRRTDDRFCFNLMFGAEETMPRREWMLVGRRGREVCSNRSCPRWGVGPCFATIDD